MSSASLSGGNDTGRGEYLLLSEGISVGGCYGPVKA